MGTYEEIDRNFEWDDAWDALTGERDGWVNLGYEVVGKHVDAGDDDRFAVRIVDFETGDAREFTYGELELRVGQFVNILDDIGVERGDRVAAMLGASPELYTTMLGCWLAGVQFVPLFVLFGPDATNYRLDDAEVKAIVTTSDHTHKVDVDGLADLEHVIQIDGDARVRSPSGPSMQWRIGPPSTASPGRTPTTRPSSSIRAARRDRRRAWNSST